MIQQINGNNKKLRLNFFIIFSSLSTFKSSQWMMEHRD